MAWTEDRVQTLRDLWAEGQSASQVAAVLGGVTRNAVIGKLHRLGLSGADRTGTGEAAQAARAREKLSGTQSAKSSAASKPRTAKARTTASGTATTASGRPSRARAKPAAPRRAASLGKTSSAAASTAKPISKPAAKSGVRRKVAPAAQSRPPVAEPVSRARTAPSAPRIPQALQDAAGRPYQAPTSAVPMSDGKFATVLTITDHMCKWPLGDPSEGDFRFCGRRTDPEEPYCTAHSRVAYQPSRRRGGGSNKALPPVMRRKAIR